MIVTTQERDYWIRIENLDQYLVSMPNFHPDDPRYLEFWRKEKRKLIEGLWGTESEGFRYCPGVLYGYGNFYTIRDTDHDTKARISVRPKIRDLEWHRAYNFLEAQGFSGFEDDDEYSSDRCLIDEGLLDKIKDLRPLRYSKLLNKNGELKKYISARENLKKLHNEPKGRPLYSNYSKNIMELGTRSGGKSYWASWLGNYLIVTDSRKYYDLSYTPAASVCVGSANTDKSSELCSKMEQGMNALATDKAVGVYGSELEDVYEPNPFYKNMAGSLEVNNKKNPYRHEYTIIHKGTKIIKGTGSSIYHVSYSPNKKSADESAAGGRYNLSLVEECGLCPNILEIHKSNIATLTTDGEKFGTEIYFGTSGNMELVTGTRKIFEHPSDYDCLEFDDVFEGTNNKIGFFIPCYMVDMRFKDKDGNTNIEEAKKYYLEKRDGIKLKERLEGEKMNYPIIPSEMWITKESSILPKHEAKLVKKRLLDNNNYKKERTFINITWDSTKLNGVSYKIIPEHEATVIDSFKESQGSNEKKNAKGRSTDTDIIIYEFPEDTSRYRDLYKFCGLDPYVADEQEKGESLGSFYILKNPKYISEGISGDIIVAEITGKAENRDKFNEKIEKLLALYGNPPQSIMFEANRGDDTKEYFIKRNKRDLLALTPVNFEDNKILAKPKLSYGYYVGNDISKLNNMNDLAEWLLTKTVIDGEEKYNIERITSIGLLDEIIEYDFELDKSKKANYDRISALIGCIVARKENYNSLIRKEESETNYTITIGNNKALSRLTKKLIHV